MVILLHITARGIAEKPAQDRHERLKQAEMPGQTERLAQRDRFQRQTGGNRYTWRKASIASATANGQNIDDAHTLTYLMVEK